MRVKVNFILSAFVLAALATPCLAQDQLGIFVRTVPEPALGLLLLVGGGFVAAKRLRRRK